MDEGLKLPPRLLALIDSGMRLGTPKEATRQNLSPIVPLERVHLFAPEEHTLILIHRSSSLSRKSWAKYRIAFGCNLQRWRKSRLS